MEDKRLKILFISSWYPHKYKPMNGIFVKRHAAANAMDCDVSAAFICSSKSNAIEESVEDGVYTLRGYYKTTKLKIPLVFQIAKLIQYLLMWRKVLVFYKNKKGKPDLINANIVYPVSIIARLIKFVWGVPYVITEHWTGYMPEDGRYKGFIKKLISRMAVGNAGAVITPSLMLSKTMLSLGLKNKYFTIYNTVDTGQFKLLEQAVAGTNFIHISSLEDEQKNVSGIIRTFNRFHTMHPSSKLTIIGNGERKEFIEKIRLKVSFSEDKGVFLVGKKEGAELAKLLQQANAFVLFSYFETQSIVLLEALCCGIPVISSKCGGPEEFVTPENGLLVDTGNEDQLLEAMERIIKNAANYKPLEIRNTVVGKVSPSIVSKQFINVYNSVLFPYSTSNIQHSTLQ